VGGGRRAWVDLLDVTAVDATAVQLLEAKRANEGSERSVKDQS
jgi:hypothetical protein